MVDATGVGAPVLDAIRRERLPAMTLPVSITSGGMPSYANGVDRIPKSDLLKRLQLLIQTERLRIPSGTPGARNLLDELAAYRRAPKRNGGIRFAPVDEATNDDLLTALSLASWAGAKVIR